MPEYAISYHIIIIKVCIYVIIIVIIIRRSGINPLPPTGTKTNQKQRNNINY